jgi:hypothetical protein
MVQELRHPEVVNVGLTTTNEGNWAMMVRVRPGTRIPIPEIGFRRRGFPVVYQEMSGNLPVARPAYPGEEY